jgi:hypothetical protein
MKRLVEGIDRGQSTLFPECLEDWICEDNPIRVIDAFVVEKLDLAELKFCGVDPRWNYCVEAHDRRHTDDTGVSHALGHHDCPECDTLIVVCSTLVVHRQFAPRTPVVRQLDAAASHRISVIGVRG